MNFKNPASNARHRKGPVHDEGWSHFKQGRAAAEPELATLGDRVRWAPIGQPVELAV